MARIALSGALALGVGSVAVLVAQPDRRVSISTLTVVDGAVLVRHGGADFEPAREGDLVTAGDTIRTGADATAEVTFFEGSSVRIEAASEIVAQSLRSDSGAPTVVVMRTFERAWGAVARLTRGASRYEIRTPSSTASVRG
jgi:hypothetical protein